MLIPVLFAAILFGTSALAIRFQGGSGWTPDDTARRSPISPDGAVTDEETDAGATIEPASSATLDKIADTLSKVHREATFAEIRLSLSQLKAERSRFDTAQTETRQDEVGRRIAGSDNLLLRYVTILKVQKPEARMPDSSDINTIRDKTMNAVDTQFTQAIAELRTRISRWRAFEQHRWDTLASLRREALAFPMGDESLADSMSHYEKRLAASNSTAVQAASAVRESQESELDKLEASLKSEENNVRKLGDRLSDIQRGELDNPQSTNHDETPVASRADYKRESKQIRSTLQAFTTPGYAQPKSATEFDYAQSKLSMSYSKLVRVGALRDTDQGIRILFFVGGSKTATQSNDRPLGPFPRMNSMTELKEKPDVANRVREAQRLLRTYGSLMVDDELLSP